MTKSLLENWLDEDNENQRLFAQEGLILEATEAIWEALEERGWNKSQLAEALGTSKANVTQLLNGSRNMTLRTLSDIAFRLNLVARVRLCERRDDKWENIDPSAVLVRHSPVAFDASLSSANSQWTCPLRLVS